MLHVPNTSDRIRRRLQPPCAAAICLLAAVGVMAGHAAAQAPNNACASAEPIAGFGTFAWDSTLCTTDGLPNPLCFAFGTDQISNDVWWCWTAPVTGSVEISTCGQTGLDTRLAAYNGCVCFEGSGGLTCNDDACSLQSRIRFPATAGNSYLIRLGSFSASATGSGTFTISQYVPVPLAGPFANPNNGSTYYLLNTSSWTLAREDAVGLGGDLATISDAAENEWVRANVLGFDGADRRGWLGFNDAAVEGQFVWSSGQTPGFTNWNGGEPNNSGGLEDYTEMFGSNGLWNDNGDIPTNVFVYGIVEVASGPTFCPADFNHSGAVTPQDIFDFLAAFFTPGSLAADFNHNGTVTPQDIFDFLSAFFSPCP